MLGAPCWAHRLVVGKWMGAVPVVRSAPDPRRAVTSRAGTGPDHRRSGTSPRRRVFRPGWQAGRVDPDGLFDLDEPDRPPAQGPPPTAPLAVRMRPRTVDEVVGQAHLLAPGAPLRR